MKVIWITLTVFIFMLSIKGGLCYICTADRILNCLEPLDDFIPREAWTSGSAYRHSPISKEQWPSFCRIYNTDVSDCLDKRIPVCSDYLKGTFQGVEDGFDYVCNEGYEDLMRHTDCLTSNLTLKDTRNCANQPYSSAEATVVDAKQMCRIVDNAFDCVADAIEDHCGEEASKWAVKVDKIIYGPLMDYLGCKKISVAHLVGAIVGSVFGAAVLLTCICCMVAAARKGRREANAQAPNPPQPQGAQGPEASLPEKVGPPPSYSEIDLGLPPKQV